MTHLPITPIDGQCWVCGTTEGLCRHHVVPRAYGGENGPTVHLCGAHHTLIHDLALKAPTTREVLLRTSSEGSDAMYSRLASLVGIIVRAKAATKHLARPLQIQHKFSTDRGQKLKELKVLIGKTSIGATLDALVDTLYSQLTSNRSK